MRRRSWRLCRLPVVEHGAGEDIHGGHGFARSGRRNGCDCYYDAYPAAAPVVGWTLRDRGSIGNNSGGRIQDDKRKTGLQDGPDPSPLRAFGVVRVHRHSEILDNMRFLRPGGLRDLLRGFCGKGTAMIELEGKKVLVIGLGESGAAAALVAAQRGASVKVVDKSVS